MQQAEPFKVLNSTIHLPFLHLLLPVYWTYEYGYQNRTIGEDLRSMICADGFVAARSTLRHVVSHHSSAKRMYFPVACDEKLEALGTDRPGTKVGTVGCICYHTPCD